MSEINEELSRPVPKAENERMGDQFGRELRWRKLWDSEKDRIAEYFHAEYFKGSVAILTMLFMSVIATVVLIISTISRFENGEHIQALVTIGLLMLLYTLLIILTKLLIHQPKKELNAISRDTALVCETEIVRKYLLKQRSLSDYIALYRLRYRADVRMPYDEGEGGSQSGQYPIKTVGMSSQVYTQVKNGDRVLVVFFPENDDDEPDVEAMEIFSHETFRQ